MDSSSHFPLQLSDTSVDDGQKNPNSLPPQLMGTDGSEQMYGDGCALKDADSSSVPAMCVAASPLPFHVSEFAPACALADRSVQWKVQPRRVAPRLRRRVFLSSRGERTHVYTSGSQSLTFELISDLSPPPEGGWSDAELFGDLF